jgi:putative hydrolase of the HAD superfamily
MTRRAAGSRARIRAVFLDSGHTLVEPLGGSWFPGHRFFEITRAHGLEIPRDAAFASALAAGYAFLEANHAVATLEEEDDHFAQYYRVILRSLRLAAPSALIGELAHAYVRTLNFAPYDDVRSALERLRALGISLAVITDSWPSVEAKFAELGLREYFSAFVISSRERCLKPDPRIYSRALRAIGVSAHETLFVDDGVDLVEKARAQGFRGLVMDRAGAHPRRAGFIRRLDELFAHLG